MTGEFRHVWRYFPEEVLQPLSAEMSADMANEIYFEIGQIFLAEIDETYLKEDVSHTSRKEKLRTEGLTDLEIMKKLQLEEARFRSLETFKETLSHSFDIDPYEREQEDELWYSNIEQHRLPRLVSEASMLKFITHVHQKLEDYGTGLEKHFSNRLKYFTWQHRLSYEVLAPFTLRPLIIAEFDRFYRTLKKQKGMSGDLLELLGDFEHSYGEYAQGNKSEDLNNTLSNAFSYLEGLTGEKLELRGRTLGALATECENSGLFPHKGTLAKSLSNLYGFPSNYPRLRHAGTPASKIRELSQQDCIALSMMALVWAGYINEQPLPPPPDTTAQEQAA